MTVPEVQPPFNYVFSSVDHLNGYLDSISAIEDSQMRTSLVDSLWQHLKENRQLPFSVGDSVVLLYKGAASSVAWAGDFNSWQSSFSGLKVGRSDVWRCVKKFPATSRIDYKIVLDGTQWILDPNNALTQMSGFGANSELRMPAYVFPSTTILAAGVVRGTLHPGTVIHSSALKYDLPYRVYTPFGYDGLSGLPVLYVTDGQEYSDDAMGALVIVLDNLIHSGTILPVMAVFIDPRNPVTGENRRMSEYNCNANFAAFLAQELVPHIDSVYHTSPTREARAILGTSMGGINSAYLGAVKTNVFKLIAIQSPAFWYNESVYAPYENGAKMDLKVFLTTGTINDTQPAALRLRSALQTKGYAYKYMEVSQGHSWGNWKGLEAEMLRFFFGH